ncbi:MAG: ABC transporter ATP-binding protein [Deltaproteobacteria bacterium]|nr:ABC transporter ATP-binding protein [Deltaproteobacteria bacterium]
MITIQSLSKHYGRQKVLDGVDLTVSDGVLFALLGPNGSGKTTLLKSLLGIVAPDPSGEIIFNNRSILGKKSYKRHVGYMPQNPKFPPHLKVRELVTLFEKLRQKKGVHKEKLAADLQIDRFWHKPFGELSGGMSQKVNILLCFMFETSLLILDEPTLGLDPSITFYLKQLMREKKTEGKTVLFTSHVMAEVEEIADRMALLVEGKIYTVIAPQEMMRQRKSKTLEEALHLFWNKTNPDEKNI